jgi:hypothetical protein
MATKGNEMQIEIGNLSELAKLNLVSDVVIGPLVTS